MELFAQEAYLLNSFRKQSGQNIVAQERHPRRAHMIAQYTNGSTQRQQPQTVI
jgi:hypothetical protein